MAIKGCIGDNIMLWMSLPRDGICGVYPTVCIQNILWDVFGVDAVYGVSDVPGKIIVVNLIWTLDFIRMILIVS